MNQRALIFLFNHTPTRHQLDDAQGSLGITRFIQPPEDIHACWRQVPPHLENIVPYLAPVRGWLSETGAPGDHVLIQGDFGATCLMVAFALSLGLIPVYSTTARTATETHDTDGRVHLSHTFQHVRFRRYGV